ncbi:MAG: hypothetical protein ACX98W_21370, partial [bacterium]
MKDRKSRCEPSPLTRASGEVSSVVVAAPWLIWLRGDDESRRVEGCRVELSRASCRPRRLVDAASGSWLPIAADDGRLVLREAGTRRLGVCSLGAGASSC